jgi:serine protease AprX
LGNDVYAFYREDGMSWAAPYIAGLAALALQLNPVLSPDHIKKAMLETAVGTSAGPVVNPAAFIEKIKGTM